MVVISGRPAAGLEALLPVPGLRLRGDYGQAPPGPAEAAALDRFAELAAPGLPAGAWLERKPGSITIHHRAVPEAGPGLLALATNLARGLGLRARAGRQAVEVVRVGADKATALAGEIAAARPAAVVFGGDDAGDAGCFELVAGLERPHLAVGIRSAEAPAGLFDRCDLVLDGPREWAGLLTVLAGWAEAGPGLSPPAAPSDPGAGGSASG